VTITHYGSLLEKDADLKTDNRKYTAQTIGINERDVSSVISKIAPINDDYGLATNMSRGDTFRNMLTKDYSNSPRKGAVEN
jgi:hypothetical protein